MYCPVARVTPSYPGPKQSGPDTERLRIKNPELVDDSLKYCSNCKQCEIACPSDVKIADIIQRAKGHFFRDRFRFRLRDFLLTRTDRIGALTTRFSPLVNFLARTSAARFLLDFGLGISRARTLPAYSQGTYRQWYSRQAPAQEGFPKRVIYFHGCYVNYNHPDLGKALIRVLNALGIGVFLSDEKCCGVPLIANGFLAEARENALINVQALVKTLDGAKIPIITTSPSCAFALHYEYPNLLEMDTRSMAGQLEYITPYLVRQLDRTPALSLKPWPMTVAYHAPCHLQRLGMGIHTVEILQKIPGLRLRLLPLECCGLSGSFGFKKEIFPISQEIGASLFQQIEAIDPDVVVTDCESCKWQIEMNTPYPVVHPVALLARALE